MKYLVMKYNENMRVVKESLIDLIDETNISDDVYLYARNINKKHFSIYYIALKLAIEIESPAEVRFDIKRFDIKKRDSFRDRFKH